MTGEELIAKWRNLVAEMPADYPEDAAQDRTLTRCADELATALPEIERRAVEAKDNEIEYLQKKLFDHRVLAAEAERRERLEGKIEQHEKDCGLCQILIKSNSKQRLTDCYPRRDLEEERVALTQPVPAIEVKVQWEQ